MVLRSPLNYLVHTPFTVLQKNPPVSLLVHACIPYFWKRIMNSDKPLLTTHAAVLYVCGVDSIMRANSKKINESTLRRANATTFSRRIVDSEIKCLRPETSAL